MIGLPFVTGFVSCPLLPETSTGLLYVETVRSMGLLKILTGFLPSTQSGYICINSWESNKVLTTKK